MTDGTTSARSASQDSGQPITPAEIQRRAVSGFLWTALNSVVSVPVAFVVNAIVARVLGPNNYGDLAFVSILLNIVTQLSNAGLSDAVLQWGSAAYAGGRLAEVRGLVSRGFGYHLLIQLPILVAVIASWPGQTTLVRLILILGVVLLCCFGSASLLIAIENRAASAAKQAMLGNLLLQGAVVASALWSGSAGIVWSFRTMTSFLLLPFLLMLLDPWGRRVARAIDWPRGFPPGFWRFGITTMATGLVGMLVFSRSEVMLLKVLGDPASVGLFALAFGIAGQITAPVDAMVGPLLPAVAGLVEVQPDRLAAGRSRILRASSMLSGSLLALVVPVLATLIPVIYGEDYRAAILPFFALAATSTFQSVCNPLMLLNTVRRRASRLLRITFAALVLDTALAVALIPFLGIGGALAANIGAQFLVFILLLRVEGREIADFGIKHLLGQMRSWFVALLAGITGTLIGLETPAQLPYRVTAALVAGGLVYVAGLRVTRTRITSQDWAALESALPPPMRPALGVVTGIVFGRDRS